MSWNNPSFNLDNDKQKKFLETILWNPIHLMSLKACRQELKNVIIGLPDDKRKTLLLNTLSQISEIRKMERDKNLVAGLGEAWKTYFPHMRGMLDNFIYYYLGIIDDALISSIGIKKEDIGEGKTYSDYNDVGAADSTGSTGIFYSIIHGNHASS